MAILDKSRPIGRDRELITGAELIRFIGRVGVVMADHELRPNI